MFINSVNYFRGIAIIFIVFGHCLEVADFKYDSIIGNTILNLTKGGTTFYVFISGFLFHHIFHEKFTLKKFMIKKTKNVLFPYLILSTLPIIYLIIRIFISFILSSNTLPLEYESLLSFPIFRHYITGNGNSFIGYWYIPFIMIVFAMSPIFVRFIKLNLKAQILIVLFTLICSIFMHKGIHHNSLSIFQNVFYFTPVYLLGMILSEKKDIIYSKFTGKEFYILILLITLAITQAYIGKFGNYHKDPFSFGGIDLMIIQKIFLCFFFIIFLNRFENSKNKLLDIIAVNSFGIFFIHGIVIWVIMKIKYEFDFSFTSNSFIIYFIVAALVFSLALIVTQIVKKTFPKYSRYLVGS